MLGGVRPKRHRKWRVFREGDQPGAGLPAFAYVLLFVLCMALGFWSVARYQTVVLWPANGVLLAGALLLRRREAIRMLAVCFVLNLIGNVVRHDAWHMVVINALLNFGEVLACAMLARRFCGATLDLRRPVRLARFAFLAVLPAVAVCGVIGTSALDAKYANFWLNLRYWITIESLGMMVTTPTMLLLARAARFVGPNDPPKWEKAALMAALVVVTAAVFAQDRAPVVFLTFLPLLVIAFRLAPHWSAMAVLVLAAISSAFSLNGMGPLTLGHMGPQNWPDQSVVAVLNTLPSLHLYTCAALAIAFGASTVLTERRQLEKQLITRTNVAQRARAAAEAAERRVTHLAQHDVETSLLNRAGLTAAVETMLDSGRLYVAALGVERFASIRTAIGSAQAAALLDQAAQRLAHVLNARIARLNADTLGLAISATNLQDATLQLSAAREAFAEPIVLGASRIDMRFAIGLAGAPEHAGDAPSLIERAQVALDQAILARRDFAVFDAAAERAAAGGLALLSELRAGMETGAVWLALQPKLDLKTGAYSGVECLLRWNHPERGAIPPDQFIPLLEETGYIGAVTEWVLERALAEQVALAKAGLALNVAVNVSARSLSEQGFADRLVAVATARGADPSGVTLEITETALMAHPDTALANLAGFKRAGFRVSIDDYGAGMSSLSYLKRIPADELKIDSSFVRGLAENKTDAVLVRSTIELAHSLGLRVVAEGVEDIAARDLLCLFGCDAAQGYLFSRPVPAERLIAEAQAENAAAAAVA